MGYPVFMHILFSFIRYNTEEYKVNSVRFIAFCFFFILSVNIVHGQCGYIPLTVNNPSFEGPPQPHVTPPGWDICMPGVTPDTQPGSWGITLPPTNGSTYLGLVHDPSISWQEGAGQTLSSPMIAGTNYHFTIDLATTDIVGSGITPGPVELQFWGGWSGTPQDEDARWKKTFSLGIRLVVDAINMLKQTGVPVDVMVIAGNHDLERSYYLGACLEAWFNNDSQVHINNEAPLRKYYRFGKVLLGLTHGSEEKESSLSMLMANDVESKSMWGETLYHEWHLGHIHRKRTVKYTTLDASRVTNEELGVTVRYLSSLTGTDAWHFSKGFIGATKAGEAFIWNDEAGLVAHLNANLIIE